MKRMDFASAGGKPSALMAKSLREVLAFIWGGVAVGCMSKDGCSLATASALPQQRMEERGLAPLGCSELACLIHSARCLQKSPELRQLAGGRETTDS